MPSTESPEEFRIPPPKAKTLYTTKELENILRQHSRNEPTFNNESCNLLTEDSEYEEISQPYNSITQTTSFDKIGKFADNITSPQFTRVTVVNLKPSYNLCDRVDVNIEARDSLNRTKTYGGDMFRVKLFTKKPYSAVNAYQILDFDNGTYLARFRVLWVGVIGLQVILVHPVEAIPFFAPTLNGSRAHLQLFYGQFMARDTKGRKHSETTTCTLTERDEPSCNLSKTDTYAPWYCSAPKSAYLNCSHWKIHKTDKKGSATSLKPLFDQFGMDVLKRTKTVVYLSNRVINVPSREKSDYQHYAQFMNKSLPYCSANGPPPLKTNGYFYEARWYPFDCTVPRFTSQETLQCLQGKTIHFFGDSTGGQIFSVLKNMLKCQSVDLTPPRKTSRLEYECRVDNITLHYTFHGLPIIGSATLNVHQIQYAATEIDNIVGGPDDFIFLSYWAHFAMTGTKFYEHRITLVKEAIYRLLDRSPGTKIFMKGANTRGYSASMGIILSSDWHALQLEKTLRSCFQNDTEIGFIDSWDITQVQPNADNVHPKTSIVSHFVDRFLTYVCK